LKANNRVGAVHLLENFAAAGVPVARYRLAVERLDTDAASAAFLIRDSADAGSICGMIKLGDILYDGVLLPRDVQQATHLFAAVDEAGFPIGTYRLGKYLSNRAGLRHLHYLSEIGHVRGRFLFATRLIKGGNVEQGVKLLDELVGQGDAEAMYYLGNFYRNDLHRARMYYQKSAALGYLAAEYEVAESLVETDCMSAMDGFGKLAHMGHAYGQYKLGSLALLREFRRPLAAVYLKVAAAQGNSDGLWRFGVLLRDSDIVAKDEVAAVDHFTQSADLGNANGKVALANELLIHSNDQSRAFLLFKEAAEMGNTTGIWCLGNCYLRGVGCERDEFEACKQFRRLAERSDPDGEYHYGKLLLNGFAIPDGSFVQNRKVGVEFIKKAADAGHSIALWRTGNFYKNGILLQRDRHAAVECYRKSAELGEPRGMFHYGESLIETNPGEAAKWFERLTSIGDSSGQFKFGSMLIDGKGVVKDVEKGIGLIELACGQGNSDAQCKYGVLVMEGVVQKSDSAAFEAFGRSAVQEYPIGLWLYAHCFLGGIGTAKDPDLGHRLLCKAADFGHAEAQLVVANSFLNGRDVPKDERLALAYYRKMAELGDPASEYQCGLLLLEGIAGVNEQIRSEGVDFIRAAAQSGHVAAQSKFGDILFEQGKVELAAFYFKLASDAGDSVGSCKFGDCSLTAEISISAF
jgi:TPR repeat protein